MARVLLAMSGGVDSSVAAALLREEGHEVIGVFMRHGYMQPESCDTSPGTLPIVSGRADHKQGCCSASDAEDGRRVADRLGIPYYALNLDADFGRIMEYFSDEYLAGRTPNPCVMCNNWLKFGKLFEYADSIGAEYVASGHYARLTEEADGPALRQGRDGGKDQSYVLFGIDRRLLPRMRFPVGDFEKPEIRERARQLGLNVAEKKDSQEICFVPDGDYAGFVRRERSDAGREGQIVTTTGEVVGQHTGIENYTIGQRKGLGVAFGEPRFVVRIEPETQQVVIGRRDELARRELTARRSNWLVEPPTAPLRCEAKIRYASRPAAAEVEVLTGNRLRVRFDEPQFGVAPGQAVVCYDGDRVLGGGWIE